MTTVKNQRAFDFVKINERENKPRMRGITEIRGPYYTPTGLRYLEDLFEVWGSYIDSIKFAGGSFSLMPQEKLRELIDLAHRYDVQVSTGGFLEYVLTQGREVTDRYIEECKHIGFDILEISTGFITIPHEDWLRLVEKVQESGLKAKPELGIQFGAGGDTSTDVLEREGTQDPKKIIAQAKEFLDAGAYLIMIESEGITENVKNWRTEVVNEIANSLGIQNVMFEAADPQVFAWYVKNYGPEVNLFVDHSQIVQLESLRRGIWGTQDLWGRVLTYKKST